MRRWTLTDLAEAQIDALRGEGIEPTPQEILNIQELSLEASRYANDCTDPAWGIPVPVGSVLLWPHTIAARWWYDKETEGIDIETKIFYLAYSMCFAHEKDKFLVFGKEAKKVVMDWALHLDCRIEQLVDACGEVFEDVPRVKVPTVGEDEDKDEDASTGGLVTFAVALMGGDPAMWEFQCTIEFVRSAIRRAQLMQHSAYGSVWKDSSKTVGMQKLAYYIDTIRKKAKDGRQANQS